MGMLFRGSVLRALPLAVASAVALLTGTATVAQEPAPEFQAQGPVDLLTVCNDALNFNPKYAAARATFLAAKQLIPQAKGKLLPQLNAFGLYDHISDTVEGDYYSLADIRFDESFDRFIYGATLEQALFRPDLFIGKNQAELRVRQASYALEAAQDALLIDVVETYFGVLAAQDALAFSRAEIEALREQVQQLDSRVTAGIATDAELKAARARYELARADEMEAENAVLTSTARLEALTGKPYPEIRRLPVNLVLEAPEPRDERAWIRRTEASNPSVLSQRAAAEVSRLEYEKAQKLGWPNLDISGAYYKLDADGGISGGREQTQERIGLRLRVPIYAGGQISATMQQSHELQKGAEALVAEVTAQAVRDTRVAYLNSLSGLQRVAALERAVEAAVSAESAIRAGYGAGTRSNSELLDSVGNRYRAERDHASARYKTLVNSLRLKQLSGQLLTADLAQLNRLLRDTY